MRTHKDLITKNIEMMIFICLLTIGKLTSGIYATVRPNLYSAVIREAFAAACPTLFAKDLIEEMIHINRAQSIEIKDNSYSSEGLERRSASFPINVTAALTVYRILELNDLQKNLFNVRFVHAHLGSACLPTAHRHSGYYRPCSDLRR